MRWALERLTEPAIEPVTIAELKTHLRLTGSEEDDHLTGLVTMARESVENTTGRALIDQTWRLSILGNGIVYNDLNTVTPVRPNCCGEFWWSGVQEIPLRRSPVIALSSFVTVDSGGTETAVSASTYALREGEGKYPRLVALDGATWNEWLNYDMRIVYRAGYADQTGSPTESASVVPARYKAAIKLICEAHYDRDDKMMRQLIECAEALLRQDRVELSMA